MCQRRTERFRPAPTTFPYGFDRGKARLRRPRRAVTAYVASAMGIVRVRVAGDTVGEFGLCERCSARDIAAGPAAVAIATDEDVRYSPSRTEPERTAAAATAVTMRTLATRHSRPRRTFVGTGFGPAVAVGYDDDGDLLADRRTVASRVKPRTRASGPRSRTRPSRQFGRSTVISSGQRTASTAFRTADLITPD